MEDGRDNYADILEVRTDGERGRERFMSRTSPAGLFNSPEKVAYVAPSPDFLLGHCQLDGGAQGRPCRGALVCNSPDQYGGLFV